MLDHAATGASGAEEDEMARSAGVEPTTDCLEGSTWGSVQADSNAVKRQACIASFYVLGCQMVHLNSSATVSAAGYRAGYFS